MTFQIFVHTSMIFFILYVSTDTTSCNRYYTSSNGTLSSPSYPNPYPIYSHCKYILDVPGAAHITVHFHDMDLAYREDFLYFGIGTEPAMNESVEIFTGGLNPGSIEVPASSVWFLFTADTGASYGTIGFNLSWDIKTGWLVGFVRLIRTDTR